MQWNTYRGIARKSMSAYAVRNVDIYGITIHAARPSCLSFISLDLQDNTRILLRISENTSATAFKAINICIYRKRNDNQNVMKMGAVVAIRFGIEKKLLAYSRCMLVGWLVGLEGQPAKVCALSSVVAKSYKTNVPPRYTKSIEDFQRCFAHSK